MTLPTLPAVEDEQDAVRAVAMAICEQENSCCHCLRRDEEPCGNWVLCAQVALGTLRKVLDQG
jgi:hypothetical protein